MTRQTAVLICCLIFWPFLSTGAEGVKSPSEIRLICEAQELLTGLGYSVGPIDGLAGPSTQQAAISFLNDIGVQNPIVSDQLIIKHLRSHHNVTHKTIPENMIVRINRPTNGQVFHSSVREEIAPLEIITPSKGYDFYVKLSEINNETTIKTFYVREGSRIKTKVPLGSYYIKYATGKEWRSKNCLFGINTLYSKADKVFEFKKSGNRISGYSVELILQIEGNLSTSKISPDEW